MQSTHPPSTCRPGDAAWSAPSATVTTLWVVLFLCAPASRESGISCHIVRRVAVGMVLMGSVDLSNETSPRFAFVSNVANRHMCELHLCYCMTAPISNITAHICETKTSHHGRNGIFGTLFKQYITTFQMHPSSKRLAC